MKLAPRTALLSSALVTLAITLFMVIVMTAIILASGYNPGAAFSGLWEYSFGDMNAFANVLNRAMALILAGLAAIVAFRAGFFNIGVEGQIFLGAMAAAIIGYRLRRFRRSPTSSSSSSPAGRPAPSARSSRRS